VQTEKRNFGGDNAGRAARKRAVHRPQPPCLAPPRQKRPKTVAFAREALGRLARILVQSGLSPAELSQHFESICSALKPGAQRCDLENLAGMTDLPHVVAHWYANEKYLNGAGEPRPLPFNGASPSLVELIALVYPDADPAHVRDQLIHFGAIRQVRRRFEPVSRYVLYRSRAIGNLHAMTALMGFLQTIEHNLSHARGKFLEMGASNPNIPARELAALRQRVMDRGTEFMYEIDADLSRLERRSRKSDHPIRVGACAFMYVTRPSRAKGHRTARKVSP
jgi:Family of unknown function (DUF6502)